MVFHNSQLPKSSELKLRAAKKNRSDHQRRPTWLGKALIKSQKESVLNSKVEKESLQMRLGQLSERINSMLRDNESRDGVERLDGAEFLIDVEGERSQKEAMKREAKNLRDQIKARDNENDAASAYLKKKHWDAMEVHRCEIRTIARGATKSVSNIPLQKVCEDDERKFIFSKRMRLIEIKEMHRDQNKASRRGSCWSSFLSNASKGNLILDPTTSPPTKSISEETEYFDTDDEEMFSYFQNVREDCPLHLLVYPPLAVRTDRQRRTQIILLRELNREIARQFNCRFDKLRQEKESVLGQLEGSNERILEILSNLQCEDECFQPSLCDREIPDSILRIAENDLVSERCESAIERIERIKREEKEAALITQENDTPARALMDMMNGTLQVKPVSAG